MSDTNRPPEKYPQATPKDTLRTGERLIITDIAKLQAAVSDLQKAGERNDGDFRKMCAAWSRVF